MFKIISCKRYRALQGELKAVREMNESVNTELKELRTDYRAILRHRDDLNDNNKALTESVNAKNARIEELERNVENLEADKEMFRSQREAHKSDCRKLMTQRHKLQEENEALKSAATEALDTVQEALKVMKTRRPGRVAQNTQRAIAMLNDLVARYVQ